MSTEDCVCNNESMTKNQSCFNCKNQWPIKMNRLERMESCPKHYMLVSNCGTLPKELCNICDKLYKLNVIISENDYTYHVTYEIITK